MDAIRELIECIVESKRTDVVLQDGSTTNFGSTEHIEELQKSLDALKHLRDRQPRSSAARFTYARAVERVKMQLQSALRFAEKAQQE